jgi:hypothetical protein
MLTQRTLLGCLVAIAVVLGLVIAVLVLVFAGIVPVPFVQPAD